MGKQMRLDRFLAEMKQGTRSQVKEMIRKGRVTVDGCPCREADRKIDPETGRVCLDGEPVGFVSVEYYMLNKPQGVISATEDGRHKTVLDLLTTRRKDLFPAGRLDIDTEGLLLLTNDGDLAHRLLAPKKHVDKVYLARVRGSFREGIEERFRRGIRLEDGSQARPADLYIERRWREDGEDMAQVRLTIHEGKFHQVKRMFEAEDCQVVFLKRLSMGSLRLDPSLAPGQYRPLTELEVAELQGQASFADILAETDAVLFDLDGTLVDSMWMWKAIDIEFLGQYGYDCPDDLQRAIEGMSFSETAAYFKERFSLPLSLEEIKAIWIRMSIDKYRHEVPLKPGAGAFLEYLKNQGIAMGIATSNGRDMVDAVLESLGISSYFSSVTTACEVAAGKPAPDIYRKVAAELQAAPERCLVFEDVPAGILAGKRAGMRVCAVEDDFSKNMIEEKQALADYYIRDYREWMVREENKGEDAYGIHT